LVLQKTDSSFSTTIPRGYAISFSEDGRFLVFKIKPFFADTRNAKIKKMMGDQKVNEDDKKCILVLEDIDCIFADRKINDSLKNNITMNGILNCLDGFNNPEGLIVIMTTNFPDKLDDALMRSGRIDLEVELTHLDKYQARNMFLSFFNNEEQFKILWDNIQKYSVEPSTLIQFLFINRNEANISDKFEDFYKLVEHKYLKRANNIYT
jgi:SpoVK/Ycf46/Vps4 family AAA+-type ATPase